VVTGVAPGRCTLAGEHVDYADGLVCCAAIDLEIAVAVRPSADGVWRVRSGTRHVERDRADLRGDVADRPFAVVEALRRRELSVPPVEMAICATLPEAAGLSSSAALSCAVLVALLRLTAVRLTAGALAEVALVAERDIAGVPCGPLDQRAVVFAPAGGAVLLDCYDGGVREVPWRLDGITMLACHTGDIHDVGGAGYRARRAEVDSALALLGAQSWRDLDAGAVAAAALPPPLDRRARHVVTETARALEAADALERGDARALGAVMTASGESLAVDFEVTTPPLDAVVAAALASRGCHGARMVGAGFGGTAVALVDEDAADACREAMVQATGGRGRGAWRLRPAAGVAVRAPDVVAR
jgi:galactokinase